MNRIQDNLSAVAKSLVELRGKPHLRIAYYSVQRRFFCPYEPETLEVAGASISFPTSADALVQASAPFDVIMLACHNAHEDRLFWELRRQDRAKLYVAWLWDNHHHHVNNLRTSLSADLVLVSHWFDRFAQISQATIVGPHLPLPTRQWSAEGVAAVFPNGLPLDREDGLFGGFGVYSFTPERLQFLDGVQKAQPNHRVTLTRDLRDYFARPYADRISEWARSKVHLVAPVNRDVSTRLFEALIVGQIPIVADECPDLDGVVSPEMQALLPILRYAPNSVESALAAHAEALRRFNAEGAEGIARRHRFAADQHGMAARLRALVTLIRRFKHVAVGEDNGQFGTFAVADSP